MLASANTTPYPSNIVCPCIDWYIVFMNTLELKSKPYYVKLTTDSSYLREEYISDPLFGIRVIIKDETHIIISDGKYFMIENNPKSYYVLTRPFPMDKLPKVLIHKNFGDYKIIK